MWPRLGCVVATVGCGGGHCRLWKVEAAEAALAAAVPKAEENSTAHGLLRALVRERPMHKQRDREQLDTEWARAWLQMNTQASVAFWLIVVYPTAWSSTRFPEARRRFPEPAAYANVPFEQMREEMVAALGAMESLPPGLSGSGGGYGMSTSWIMPASLKLVLGDDHVQKLGRCVRALREAIKGGSTHVCGEATQRRVLDGPMAPGEVYGRGQYLSTHAYGAMAWCLQGGEGRLNGAAYRQMGSGFSPKIIGELRKIASDVGAFNRLVRVVCPELRWLDWRDIGYMFCMNGKNAGGVATKVACSRVACGWRWEVTGNEPLWRALRSVSVEANADARPSGAPMAAGQAM